MTTAGRAAVPNIPDRHYLVHDTDLAMLEGHIIGVFSGTPPLLTPDDMDELNRRFDHIRSRHEQLMGTDIDKPIARNDLTAFLAELPADVFSERVIGLIREWADEWRTGGGQG